MSIWLIPFGYLLVGVAAGLLVPRLEFALLPDYGNGMSVSSAQAYLSAVASGMMTLTAIVYSLALVMVQFSTSAYSKRLALLLSESPLSAHALGAFFATFTLALGALLFVDRERSGNVPLLSMQIVTGFVALSMVALVLLVRRMTLLQVTHVLRFVGDKGRAVIRETFPRFEDEIAGEIDELKRRVADLRATAPSQKLRHLGAPRAVTRFRLDDCVREARRAGGIIVMRCAIGDTLAEGTVMAEVYGTPGAIPDAALRQCIELATNRRFKRDPKYPLRLLVDSALMALSPAVNDPTTAVQALDQIQDLLYRLGRCALDTGFVKDAQGDLRLVFPMPTWEDYLSLALDEIRMYGASSIQVVRRLRVVLFELEDSLTNPERVAAVRRYLEHLDAVVDQAAFDSLDRTEARQADPQGLGHTHPR